MKTSIILLLGILVSTGCTKQGQVTVVNNSTATLTKLVVLGSGYSLSLGPIAPHAKQTVTLSRVPDGRAGLTLDFDADGKHYSSPRGAGVWNGMKEVILTVDPAFTVKEEAVTTF